jgi:pSer/pThr/pTyr-binding forkhead associated (FHA) protein
MLPEPERSRGYIESAREPGTSVALRHATLTRISARHVMRVVCVHPARDPRMCGDGPVQFGSSPDSDIVLAGAGVDPRHATLVADARGLVLTVCPGSQRVYVNARPVRERALLRCGDTLTLGANKFLLMADAPPPPARWNDAADSVAWLAMLRVVSGTSSGRAFAVAPELRLGAGTRHFGELAGACRVTQSADSLVFEPDTTMPQINGWRCGRVRLSPGDQIVLGEHRLVVEAPGLQYAAYVVALPPPPVAEPVPPPDDSSSTGIWWLIAAAAVLALLIAFFLYSGW